MAELRSLILNLFVRARKKNDPRSLGEYFGFRFLKKILIPGEHFPVFDLEPPVLPS